MTYYKSKEPDREWLAVASFVIGLIVFLVFAVAMIVNWLAERGGAPGILKAI